MRDIFSKLGIFMGVSALLAIPFLAVASNNEKITICHATGSETNPYIEIRISVNGISGHTHHQGDIIPVPIEGCDAFIPPNPE